MSGLDKRQLKKVVLLESIPRISGIESDEKNGGESASCGEPPSYCHC